MSVEFSHEVNQSIKVTQVLALISIQNTQLTSKFRALIKSILVNRIGVSQGLAVHSFDMSELYFFPNRLYGVLDNFSTRI